MAQEVGEDVTALMNQPQSGEDVTSLMNVTPTTGEDVTALMVEPEEQGFISKMLSPVSAAPGDWLRDIASSIDAPKEGRSPFEAMLRGGVAGMIGGMPGEEEIPLLGRGGVAGEVDVATSPVGLGTLAIKPLAKGARLLGKGVKAGAEAFPNVFKKGAKVAEEVVEELPTVSATTGEISGAPAARLVAAMEKAEPLTRKQAKIYTAERAERLAKMGEVETPGIAGHFERKAQLAGEMKKVQMRPLSTQVSGEDMNELANAIQNHPDLLGFESVSATEGLLSMYSGRVPQPGQIKLLRRVFGGDFEEGLIKLAGRSERGIFGKTQDFMRSVLTSNDFSAPGIQGRKFISYPEYWSAFSKQFKAWGSQTAHNAIRDSIMAGKNFRRPRTGEIIKSGQNKGKMRPDKSVAERAGLDLTDLVGNKEEKFRSTFAEKFVPGVLRSERAYVSFLNKLRADMFNRLVKDSKEYIPDILDNNVELKNIADLINDATGRGSLGKWGQEHAQLLNDTFFAPKLQAGRVRSWARVFNPQTYTQQNKAVRKAALRSLLTATGFGITVGELGRMAGAKVTNDPTSSDYRKMVIDNVRVDPMGGESQYMTAAARMLLGQTTSSTTGRTTALRENVIPYVGPEIQADRDAGTFGGQTMGGILADFAANRLAPVPSMAVRVLFNKFFPGGSVETLTGIEDPFLNELADSIVPIMVQDIVELAEEDPSLLPLAVPSAFGLVNVQSYGRR